jgi:hypothetical protein
MNMNTQTITRTPVFSAASAGSRVSASTLYRYGYRFTRALAAVAAGATLLTASIWIATQPGLGMYLQAFNWCTSLVFLAVAFDVKKTSTALMALATGIGILLLTGVSTRLGLEFALWGTLLIAAWLTTAIIRR